MSATADLKKLFTRLKKVTGQAVNAQEMKFLGNEAIKIVVKRTRLGYGVKGAERFPLKSLAWTDKYAKLRKTYPLDETTSPKKSNLTLTGQMLRSVKIIQATGNSVTIGPQGMRKEGSTNEAVAEGNAKRGRVFMALSLNESNQLVRIYRKRFTDLMKRLAKAK